MKKIADFFNKASNLLSAIINHKNKKALLEKRAKCAKVF
jgi:hypothetical protein